MSSRRTQPRGRSRSFDPVMSAGAIIAATAFLIGAVSGRSRMFRGGVIVCWSALVLPNLVTGLFSDRLSRNAGEAAGALLMVSSLGGLYVLAPLTGGIILSLMIESFRHR
jgi:hypothetical protein